MDDDEGNWQLPNMYLKQNGLVKHQIESFDAFACKDIKRIIDEIGPIEVVEYDAKLVFGEISLSKPSFTEGDGKSDLLFPREARLRNLTYCSSLYVEANIIKDNRCQHSTKIFLGKIPVMVGSCLCNQEDSNDCKYDPGGYFIVTGSEKVLIAQEKMNNNQIYIFNKKSAKYIWEIEIRSLAECQLKSTNTVKMSITNPNADYNQYLRLSLPFFKSEIPVFLLFHIFDQTDYFKYVYKNQLLIPSIAETESILASVNIIDYIQKKLIYPQSVEYVKSYIKHNLFPHIINNDSKVFLLGRMINKICDCNAGKVIEDDRDHFKNKRVDISGHLLSSLFRQLYKKMHKDLSNVLLKTLEQQRSVNLNTCMKSKIITNGLKYALATGNWGVSTQSSIRTGVSQVLNRHSYLSMLSHLRRITSPIGKDGKHTTPRQLHGSHAFRICPSETPEGSACGLVKNMALSCLITLSETSECIRKILENEDHIENLDLSNDKYLILINGDPLGVVLNDYIDPLYDKLKLFKRSCDINPTTGIAIDHVNKELRINTDGGRCYRPLLIVKDRSIAMNDIDLSNFTWDELISNAYVEYVDADEEDSCLIAFDENDLNTRKLNFTHCEIHPSFMLGISTANIPFPEHNQAPRVVYQAAMCKQAMGVFARNFSDRIDTYSHVLWYPQKPLVRTQNSITMNMNEMPSGINAIVAIMCYSGYNQEDSIMMNQSSIDRGLFRSFFFRAYKDEHHQGNQVNKDMLCKPTKDICQGMKLNNYEKVDQDGLVSPGIFVSDNDILIGKVSGSENDNIPKDMSTAVKHNEGGVVDKIVMTMNEQGMKMIKARVRSTRVPEIGDKFASRHAQKGTIGITYRYEDMPFTADGIVPDIIVNPHAIPSRMTIGQLIECIYGKKCALSGTYGDGTAFSNPDPSDIINALQECGYQKHGEETLYHGHTGEPIKAKIFIGPTYYQRLKHMVNDKIHSRGRGPIQILTRQPVEGRSRDGGLRFGEMEKDCIISHGASAFLKERLMDQSDAYDTHVCNTCGLFCINDVKNKTMFCKKCNEGNVSHIKIPYACKLLFQELISANIIPRIQMET